MSELYEQMLLELQMDGSIFVFCSSEYISMNYAVYLDIWKMKVIPLNLC